MRNLPALCAIVGFSASPVTAHDEVARAHYLGNEGVMVVHGETKILFDAFYAQSYGQYALVPDDISEAMLAGAPPYDGVDAVFVSHIHGDHFSAAPAIAYLRAQTSVRLFGSIQVRAAIIDAGVAEDDPIMARITAIDLAPEDSARSFELDGVAIDLVAIPHAGDRPDIQNFAWRVALDEALTVMHLGDAGPVVEDFERHKDHFLAKKTHAAFPPYWFFGYADGEAILNTYIKADKTIGVHVPARAAENGARWRADAGGDLFTDPGEMRDINAEPSVRQ